MELQDIAEQCVNHLQQEEAFVGELKRVVQEIRAAMLSRDDQQLSQHIAQLQAVDYEAVSQRRAQLRVMIAHICHVRPEQAKVRMLASRCSPETASQLLEHCDRLRQTTQEVASLATANGNLAFQLWEILERSFCALSGGNGAPLVYEPSGHRRVA